MYFISHWEMKILILLLLEQYLEKVMLFELQLLSLKILHLDQRCNERKKNRVMIWSLTPNTVSVVGKTLNSNICLIAFLLLLGAVAFTRKIWLEYELITYQNSKNRKCKFAKSCFKQILLQTYSNIHRLWPTS